MNELALFAGAGGGILGGHLLGWRTVCAVERDAYAAQVLAQRQNDGILKPFPIWSDVTTFDGKPWRGIVDVVSGGFPCQDISAAGKGAGITGERSGLWKEFDRIIGEVEPSFVYVENSPMLTIRGLGVVLGDLAARGFNAEWGVLSAADVGAPHLRERAWILGYTRGIGCYPRRNPNSEYDRSILGANGQHANKVAYSNINILQGLVSKSQQSGHGRSIGLHGGKGSSSEPPIWPIEPNVGRVADGVAHRVDRIKGLGNGQIPRVAATAFTMLAERAGF